MLFLLKHYRSPPPPTKIGKTAGIALKTEKRIQRRRPMMTKPITTKMPVTTKTMMIKTTMTKTMTTRLMTKLKMMTKQEKKEER